MSVVKDSLDIGARVTRDLQHSEYSRESPMNSHRIHQRSFREQTNVNQVKQILAVESIELYSKVLPSAEETASDIEIDGD